MSSTEIERYQPQAPDVRMPTAGTAIVRHDPAANPLDGWIQVMADVAKLAEYIADTELVPEAVRRRPAAVAAIILTGREMSLPPMMALRHIHIVKGKPGMSAEIMRAQVLSAGHELDYIETTDTRCVVKGRRRGEADWLTVSFTADQARKARIDLGGYPEDKLVARATSRLCRRKFADCIAGVPTVDEIEDEGVWAPAEIVSAGDHTDEAQALPAAAPKQQRTAQRRSKPKVAPARPAAAAPPAQPATAPAQRSGPPLPGEDGYDDVMTGRAVEAADDATDQRAPSDPPPSTQDDDAEPTTEDSGDEPCSNAQRNKLFALFRETDFDDRNDRLTITSRILDRHIGSWGELTKRDANVLIDMFEALHRNGDLVARLTELLSGHDTHTDQE